MQNTESLVTYCNHPLIEGLFSNLRLLKNQYQRNDFDQSHQEQTVWWTNQICYQVLATCSKCENKQLHTRCNWVLVLLLISWKTGLKICKQITKHSNNCYHSLLKTSLKKQSVLLSCFIYWALAAFSFYQK